MSDIALGCRRNLGIRTPKATGIARRVSRIATRGCTPLNKLCRRRPALIAVGSLHWWVADARAATLLPLRGLAIIAVVELLSMTAPWWLVAKRDVINDSVCVTSARTCPWRTEFCARAAGASKARYVYTVGCPLRGAVNGMVSFFVRSATTPCKRTGANTAEKMVPRFLWARYDVVAKADASDQCMCAIAASRRIGPTTSCAASVGRTAGTFASSAKGSQPKSLLILGIAIAGRATDRRAVATASTATTPCGGVRARVWNPAFE